MVAPPTTASGPKANFLRFASNARENTSSLGSELTQRLMGRVNGLLNMSLGVSRGNEKRFELRAGHVDTLLDQLPEVLRILVGI